MAEKSGIPIIDQFKFNAIKDPEELVKIAVSHKNPDVCKAAIDKLIKMDLIEERKALLICSIAKETDKESVANHAFGYCSVSKLSDDTKARMIKKSIDKIKFESLRKEMEKWLEEYERG